MGLEGVRNLGLIFTQVVLENIIMIGIIQGQY